MYDFDYQPQPQRLLADEDWVSTPQTDADRQVGQKASAAMTEVLKAARPTWTEYQLAGAGAEALWARGLHPALTLVAGDRRLPLYRHATPTGEKLGRQAMLVFCARGYGLYANLTRFVCFGSLSKNEAELHRHV
ncbi:M24 family metallopeptidase [Nostoc cycadae]|uniref:Peptidase M24 n=1 Tax=Nostoc cycadae WK-1 TaxID=1861711 RepID=A0A2H6LDJ4_9NOSO|nr:M24 family metallopeptidase [Nostoc cycadae]GBE91281.1 peptidase M24 [Nostoc cycadae WK-1]